MTDDELREIEARAAGEIASERYRVRELIAALRAERARVRALEYAARVDINAASAECAARDCASWVSRGRACDECPCDTVSEMARVVGVELASAQKLADAGKVAP